LGVTDEKGRLKVADDKMGVTPFQAMYQSDGLSCKAGGDWTAE